MFKNIINSIGKKQNNIILKPLHRWKIDYTTENLNRKIDLANEDHCGPCGQYSIKNKNDNNQNYEYSPFSITNIDFLIYYELKN
jgi:hypothetical protein